MTTASQQEHTGHGHHPRSIEEILAEYPRSDRGWLIPIFHDVTHAFGYIPPETVPVIAAHVGLTPIQVDAALTFYSELRKTPPAEHAVRFCMGPACYARGLHKLVRVAEHTLGIPMGGITEDRNLELQPVQCNGTCNVAPLMNIDHATYGRLKLSDVRRILTEFAQQIGHPLPDTGGQPKYLPPMVTHTQQDQGKVYP